MNISTISNNQTTENNTEKFLFLYTVGQNYQDILKSKTLSYTIDKSTKQNNISWEPKYLSLENPLNTLQNQALQKLSFIDKPIPRDDMKLYFSVLRKAYKTVCRI